MYVCEVGHSSDRTESDIFPSLHFPDSSPPPSSQRYLIPQARSESGVGEKHLSIASETISSLIKWYCRESGVRNLQKHIEKVLTQCS